MNWVNAVIQGMLLGGQYALIACGLSLAFGLFLLAGGCEVSGQHNGMVAMPSANAWGSAEITVMDEAGQPLAGAIIKPFSLTIRLFANMIAGHIVLASLILLIPLTAGFAHQLGVGAPVTILSLLIRVLELFVAFLQAYIFTFLVTLFIASAVAPEH